MSNFVPTIHPWNQQIWQSLTNESERTNHALLFAGNRGLGKQTLAFSLAHFVLCDTHSQSEALFNGGSHPDLHVIMAEDQVAELKEEDLLATFAKRYHEPHGGKPKRTITIEQIRKLSLSLATHPHISRHRMILIIGAEAMNNNAANALLKSLEEPPSNTLFVIVSDEVSRLAKTVRSRCSLVSFRAPDAQTSRIWFEQQSDLPTHEIDNHLAMANNHPLLALRLHEENYKESLKSVFTDVNGLWNQRREPIQVAKNWQSIGASKCVDILQKLLVDLLKNSLSDNPQNVFFPVQETWVKSVSVKFSRKKLIDLIESLNYAKKMLNTTVDHLLVLETVSNDFRKLATN